MKLEFAAFMVVVLVVFLASCTSLTSLFAGLWQVGGVVLLSEGNMNPTSQILSIQEISKGVYSGAISAGGNSYSLDNLSFKNGDISFDLNGITYTGKLSGGDIKGVTPAEWMGTRIK